MKSHNLTIGKIGECYAEQFLLSLNYQILTRNFRCRYGEIDLIALDTQSQKNDYSKSPQALFVEVKTRISLQHGQPQEAVGFIKSCRILKTIWHYRKLDSTPKFRSWRIDVIAVILNKNKELISIEHFRNIQIG